MAHITSMFLSLGFSLDITAEGISKESYRKSKSVCMCVGKLKKESKGCNGDALWELLYAI